MSDICICGRCSTHFSDWVAFVKHKQQGCSVSSKLSNSDIHLSQVSGKNNEEEHHTTKQGDANQTVLLTESMLLNDSTTTKYPGQVCKVVLQNVKSQYNPIDKLSFASPPSEFIELPNNTLFESIIHINNNSYSPLVVNDKFTKNNPSPEVYRVTDSPSISNVSNPEALLKTSYTPTQSQIILKTNPIHSSSKINLKSSDTDNPRVIDEKSKDSAVRHFSGQSAISFQRLVPGSVDRKLYAEEEDVASFLANQLMCQTNAAQFQGSSAFSSSVQNSYTPLNEQITDDIRISESPTLVEDKCTFVVTSHSKLNAFEADGRKHVAVNPSSQGVSLKTAEGSVTLKSERRVCCYDNCQYSTTVANDMVRHIRVHTGERPFTCEICNKSFSRKDKLSTHRKLHDNDKPHRCPTKGCLYASVDRSRMKKHLRTHTNERPYQCEVCPYSAKDRSQLVVHIRTHTGDSPFTCMQKGCEAAFKTSSGLKRHATTHHKAITSIDLTTHHKESPFLCQYCPYSSLTDDDMKVHCLLVHEERGEQVTMLTNSQDFPSITPPVDKNSSPVKSKCSSRRKTESKRSKVFSKLAKHVCDLCNRRYMRIDSYRAHMRLHHTNS